MHGRSCDRPEAVLVDGTAGAAVLVELLGPLVLAQVGGPDLGNGLGANCDPKLLGALHPLVELLDQRLDCGAGDGQARLAILRIIRSVGFPRHILQAQRHDAARTIIGGGLVGAVPQPPRDVTTCAVQVRRPN